MDNLPSNRFKKICHGETYDGVPAIVHFQSDACFQLYQSGKLPDDLGFTLTTIDHTKELTFWFDNLASKQQWIDEELTLVEKSIAI